ncbi:MAG TPA: helical backbone metal receptor [Thermoanaerobaculia bacterium]|nr:helical backbone metal receptor [Thermoanaerobaculia bacterium]
MIVDVRGHQFDLVAPPQRVISLVPSLTESLFDLGVGPGVVAVTDFCIFPDAQVKGLPRIGGTKNPDIDEIRRLAPDLVYVNLEENLKRHAEAISAFAPVFATEPKTVPDVIHLLMTLGAIHGRESEARSFAFEIDRLLENHFGPFTFAVAIWKDPWMWCGGDTYVSALVTAAGGVNVLEEERRYPNHNVDRLCQLEPEIIFLPDEPFVFKEADATWLGATTGSRIVGPFPGHLFTWHGTRTLLGMKLLENVLGPIEEDAPS